LERVFSLFRRVEPAQAVPVDPTRVVAVEALYARSRSIRVPRFAERQLTLGPWFDRASGRFAHAPPSGPAAIFHTGKPGRIPRKGDSRVACLGDSRSVSLRGGRCPAKLRSSAPARWVPASRASSRTAAR